ncbi:MAG: biotin--[acetyl-CoA-carboxylase] ligase [Planctomycetota bacterium]
MPRLIHETSVDSTNERAFAALAAGTARHGDVHVADEQTAGRGSRGRHWHSPPGAGLYASVVWMPPPPAPAPSALTMAAALAVRDAALALGASELVLKWPNDLLAAGAKLCGILVESRGLDPERPAFVCGIGLNLLQRDFPADLGGRPATSLALLGHPCEAADALAVLLPRLEQRLDQARAAPERLAADFASGAGLATGRAVLVRRGERTDRGAIEDLRPGGLVLRTPGGSLDLPLEHISAVELL